MPMPKPSRPAARRILAAARRQQPSPSPAAALRAGQAAQLRAMRGEQPACGCCHASCCPSPCPRPAEQQPMPSAVVGGWAWGLPLCPRCWASEQQRWQQAQQP